MRTFDVQDVNFVFDCDGAIALNSEFCHSWRDRLEEEFDDFVRALSEEIPDSFFLRMHVAARDLPNDESTRELFRLASHGFSPASFLLFYLYDTGELGFEKNPKLASKFELHSAHLLHPQALWNIGLSTLNLGVEREKGIFLIVKSAVLGFEPAIDFCSEKTISLPNLEIKDSQDRRTYSF